MSLLLLFTSVGGAPPPPVEGETRAAGWIGRPRHAHVNRAEWERIKKELEIEFRAAEEAQRVAQPRAKQLLKTIDLVKKAVKEAEAAQVELDQVRLRNVLQEAAEASTAAQRLTAINDLKAANEALLLALDDEEAWIVLNA